MSDASVPAPSEPQIAEATNEPAPAFRDRAADTPPSAAADTPAADAQPVRPEVDLGAIEADLAGVEAALRRLDDGTYWSDEVTGDPIPDDVLAADPVARRAT